MKVFTYSKNRERRQADRQAVLEMLSLSAGICGILLALRSLPYISFSEGTVFACAVLVCGGMYGIYTVRRKWALPAGVLLLAVCGIAAAVQNDLFLGQLSAVWESLTDMGVQSETDATFVFSVAAAALSVCFFILESIWRQHWLPYAAVTGVMAGAPFFGIQIGLLPVLLGLAFQILFWTIHIAERRTENRRGAEKRKRSLPVRCSIFMGVTLCVLAGVSVVITTLWGSGLADLVYSGEGFVSRSMQQITGRAETPTANGRVSAGNNYHTGRVQAEVTLMEQPEGTLYLKGFTGGEYIGGEWQAAEDGKVFLEIADRLHWESWEAWIGGMFTSMYFVMNEASAESSPEPRQVFIRHADESYQTMYTPYFSGWPDYGNAQEPGYAYQYYEEQEMDVDWENVPDEFTRVRDWYRDIEGAYIQVIEDAYTGVPEDLLPRLTELCRGGEVDSLDDATLFILDTFRAGVSYTLTPGRAPLNEDIVEYFLFENHEGYCVHFASAATLMYRLLGYPARYVSGYALQPSDFIQQEDGTWQAGMTDESAHAWTEIFLENYGWIPVEVTPASDGSYNTSYPGLDTETLEQILSEVELDLGVSDMDAGAEESAGTDRAEEENGGMQRFSFDIDPEKYHDLILIVSVILAESLLLLPLFLDYRKLRRRRKEECMDCRRIFSRLLKLLSARGLMPGYNGTEEDFPEKLAETLPCISREEAERIVEIVSRAAYGYEDVTEEEDEFVRVIYFRAEKWLNQRD